MKYMTTNKQFQCPYDGCGKAFVRKSDMKRHTNKHLGLKPFACSKCGKKFPQKGNLTTHIRTHTGEKPFVCDFPGCLRTFSDQSSCARHRTEYHTDDVYVCPVEGCCVRVKRHCIFKAHMRKHYGSQVEQMDLSEYISPGETRMDRDTIIPPVIRLANSALLSLPTPAPTPSTSPASDYQDPHTYPSQLTSISPIAQPSALASVKQPLDETVAYTRSLSSDISGLAWGQGHLHPHYFFSPSGDVISRQGSPSFVFKHDSASLTVPPSFFNSTSTSPMSCYASTVPSPMGTPPPMYYSMPATSPPPPYHAEVAESADSSVCTPQLLNLSLALPSSDFCAGDKPFDASMSILNAPMDGLDAELDRLFGLEI